MRVYIGPYINYIGPYQIANLLKHIGVKEEVRDKVGDFLANKTPIGKWCEFVYSKRSRKVNIKLDRYDHWNADSTLALVILPVLKQLKASQIGAGMVDDEDVPEELRRKDSQEDYDSECCWQQRWDFVLNEMIWAFEQVGTDWESQYYTFNDMTITNYDEDGIKSHQERMKNGLRLFGKYYLNLWD